MWLIKVKNNVNFVKNMYSDYPLKKYESDMKILKNHIISHQKEYQKLLKDDNGNLDTINNTIDSYFSKWEKRLKSGFQSCSCGISLGILLLQGRKAYGAVELSTA